MVHRWTKVEMCALASTTAIKSMVLFGHSLASDLLEYYSEGNWAAVEEEWAAVKRYHQSIYISSTHRGSGLSDFVYDACPSK
ncbi:hypothetical protein RRG08_015874 [Elysia crispata]|uniref:Uncharacterized protein n=1 Tax=Elysia crispata TaxID=231223 RepID=A0AAE0YM19_9GAST|nr:hypothetical protein RRG08_015874 [Elysia crispata]